LTQEDYIVFLDLPEDLGSGNGNSAENDTWELSRGGGGSWRRTSRPARAEQWRPGGRSGEEVGGGGWGPEGE